MVAGTLSLAVCDLVDLRRQLADHEKATGLESARLKGEIVARQTILNTAEAGLDNDKIALAQTVLKVRGLYAKGGEDRASVIQDAVSWLATQKVEKIGSWGPYTINGLDSADFGTKSYDRWHGQRSDHEWGGPRHGTIIFQVGLIDRQRKLTEEEREAAIYYLLNLERAQAAAQSAREAA